MRSLVRQMIPVDRTTREAWDERELDQLDGRIREAVQRLASIPEIEAYRYTVQRKIPCQDIVSVKRCVPAPRRIERGSVSAARTG